MLLEVFDNGSKIVFASRHTVSAAHLSNELWNKFSFTWRNSFHFAAKQVPFRFSRPWTVFSQYFTLIIWDFCGWLFHLYKIFIAKLFYHIWIRLSANLIVVKLAAFSHPRSQEDRGQHPSRVREMPHTALLLWPLLPSPHTAWPTYTGTRDESKAFAGH